MVVTHTHMYISSASMNSIYEMLCVRLFVSTDCSCVSGDDRAGQRSEK